MAVFYGGSCLGENEDFYGKTTLHLWFENVFVKQHFVKQENLFNDLVYTLFLSQI